ncbi:MAG: DUF4150 domain-containing protein [Candidatus Eisenbacteria bacterium]
MPATVNVNMRTVVHASSNGQVMGFPDVCKTPTPAGPVPIPYPNVAMSSNLAQGSTTVKMDGNPIAVEQSNFSTSTGDEAGSAGGGVVSNTIKGKAEFVMNSFDVKVDGKGACRMLDIMLLNKQSAPNTPPFPELQPPAVVISIPVPEPSEDEPSISQFEVTDRGQEQKQ